MNLQLFCLLFQFKIALCQLAVTTDKEKNIAHARHIIEGAAAKGAKLILLPVSHSSLKRFFVVLI